MLLDSGSSSSPGAGKGPLKPAPKKGSTLDEWMRRPSSAADQVHRESAPKTTGNPYDDWMRPQGSPAVYDQSKDLGTLAMQHSDNISPEVGDETGRLGFSALMEKRESDAERAKRAEVLGITTGALSTTPEMVKDLTDRLTTKEYNALSEKQRAAVDFNTTLAMAVRRDLKHQEKYDPSKTERGNYDAAVESMFGKDRGSDIYAPETMAVLRQLKIDDKSGDLDDYLGLKVAITEDDLKNFDQGPGLPGPAVIDGRAPEADRDKLEFKQHLVDDATTAMQEAIDKGAKLMQGYRATLATVRRQDIEDMGGIYKSPEARSGFGVENLDRMISGTYNELLGYDKPKIAQALQAMRENLPEDQLTAFFNYADSRTRMVQQRRDVPLSDAKTKYTPEQVRALLGLKD